MTKNDQRSRYATMTDNDIKNAVLAIRNRQNSSRSNFTIQRCVEGVKELRDEWVRRHGKDARMFA